MYFLDISGFGSLVVLILFVFVMSRFFNLKKQQRNAVKKFNELKNKENEFALKGIEITIKDISNNDLK